MTPDELKELVSFGREQRHVEFKSGGSLEDKNLRAKVFRAIMAMANLRDGGTLLIGVTENGQDIATITGVSDEDVGSWRQDDVASKLKRYADPPPEFVLEKVRVDEVCCVVLRVQQFASVPIVCCQSAHLQEGKKSVQLLREGACYVRSLGSKPESVDISTAAEMRELLDLATSTSLRHFIAIANAAGLRVQTSGPTTQQINARRVRAFAERTPSVILERGFWRVEIYPVTPVTPTAHAQELIAIADECRVSARGYGYPSLAMLDDGCRHLGADHLRLEYLGAPHKDVWCLWQDGCFAHARALWGDWKDEASSRPDPGWKAGEQLSVEEAVYFSTEVFEFAARLAQSAVGAAQYVARLSLSRLHGRRVVVGWERHLGGLYRSMTSDWSSPQIVVDRDVLIARRRELAVETMQHLFLCFNWQASTGALRSIQEEIVEFRKV